mmetsp:Transcript_12287/g.30036  ORF Transcript_12287/g.30036 Transcript_12287/m.30036 type:complete len:266 (-) Transcript_12287:413-1210(-)
MVRRREHLVDELGRAVERGGGGDGGVLPKWRGIGLMLLDRGSLLVFGRGNVVVDFVGGSVDELGKPDLRIVAAAGCSPLDHEAHLLKDTLHSTRLDRVFVAGNGLVLGAERNVCQMHHVGNIRMALKDPLQQRHLSEVEKFRYGGSHVGPVKSNGFRAPHPLRPSRAAPQVRGGQLVKYPKRTLSLHLEMAHLLLAHDLVNRLPAAHPVLRRLLRRRGDVRRFVLAVDSQIVDQQQLAHAVSATQGQCQLGPDEARRAGDEDDGI